MEFFAEIIFKKLFCKKLQVRCLADSIRRLEKALSCFASLKTTTTTTRIIYTSMYVFTFPRENVIDQKGVGWAGRGVVIKWGRWNI